jgi:hypothetical protein
VIVGAFVLFWVASVVWYKARRIDERFSAPEAVGAERC